MRKHLRRTHICPWRFYPAHLGYLITRCRTEGEALLRLAWLSSVFFLPCVDCADSECGRPREAGAPHRSQISDPPSPSNNTRRREHHQLHQGYCYLPKCHLALFGCFVIFFKKWQRKGGESRPPVLVKLLKAKLNWFKHRRQTGLSIYIKYVLQCLWSAIEGCSSGHPSELLMQQAAVGFITTAQYIYINTKASTYVRVFYLIKDDQQCNSMSLIMKTDLHRSFIVDIWPQGGISFQTNCSMIG